MSFLKKNGQRVWVPEVIGKKYVPGYWYTYTEYVPKYVSGGSSGSASGPKSGSSGSASGPKTKDRYLNFDHGMSGSDPSRVIVDY